MSSPRDDAYDFLREFGQAIIREAPKGSALEPEIRRIVAEAKKDDRQKHLRLPEAAFLNRYVVPVLFRCLQGTGGLTESEATVALLNEYWRTMPEYSVQSPTRRIVHPFKKTLGAGPETIYRQWTDPQQRFGLTQACPDFALRSPFPHRILFEGKYFARGSSEYAARQLVTNIYQAFFYRALPKVDATKTHPEWDYDYACLLAFDASPNGTLKAAWDALEAKVKRSFWEGANIYVMILRD